MLTIHRTAYGAVCPVDGSPVHTSVGNAPMFPYPCVSVAPAVPATHVLCPDTYDMLFGMLSITCTTKAEHIADVLATQMQNVTVAPEHSKLGLAALLIWMFGFVTSTVTVTQYDALRLQLSAAVPNVAHATFVIKVPSVAAPIAIPPHITINNPMIPPGAALACRPGFLAPLFLRPSFPMKPLTVPSP
jgi:hypothetical protein